MSKRLKQTFNVKGMSCVNCEAAIERAFRELGGVYSVRASFASNQVTVIYDPDIIKYLSMRSAVKRAGYTLIKLNAAKPGEGKNKLTVFQFIGIALALLAVYLIIQSTLGFNFIPEITPSMGYGVLFIVGLLTSLHCIAMCGGINMSQCLNGRESIEGIKAKVRPSLLYNLGRLTSYTLIGGIVGMIGSFVSFTGWARGLVAIVSGLFMVIMGLSMTGLFPWINKITPRLPRTLRTKTTAAGKGRGPYIVGLLNGFMPCGPLQAMQIYALGTGSFVAGALSMFSFGLGTLPLMFGLGTIITILGSKFTNKMMSVSAALVAVLGIVMLFRGFALSGLNIAISPPQEPESSAISAPPAVNQEEAQLITSTLSSRGYPNIVVQKGVPVVWNLKADSSALSGCNRTMVIPEYNLEIRLKAGDNIIKFTPQESGTFTYTCWMGMLTGKIKVEN